jgi:hypothetical protein
MGRMTADGWKELIEWDGSVMDYSKILHGVSIVVGNGWPKDISCNWIYLKSCVTTDFCK